MIPLGTYPKGTKLRLTDVSKLSSGTHKDLTEYKDTIVELREDCKVTMADSHVRFHPVGHLKSLYAKRFSLVETPVTTIHTTF